MEIAFSHSPDKENWVHQIVRKLKSPWLAFQERRLFKGSIKKGWAYFRSQFESQEEVDMYGLLCSMPFRTGPTRIQVLRERFIAAYPERDSFLLERIEAPNCTRELVYAVMMLNDPNRACINEDWMTKNFVACDLHFMQTYSVRDWFESWLEQHDDLRNSIIDEEQ